MVLLVLIGALAFASPSTDFEVFGCLSKQTTTAVYDVRQPAQCPDPKESYLPPSHQRIQVCQELEEDTVLTLGCRVLVSRTDSLTYVSRWVEFEEPIFVTPEECRRPRG